MIPADATGIISRQAELRAQFGDRRGHGKVGDQWARPVVPAERPLPPPRRAPDRIMPKKVALVPAAPLSRFNEGQRKAANASRAIAATMLRQVLAATAAVS